MTYKQTLIAWANDLDESTAKDICKQFGLIEDEPITQEQWDKAYDHLQFYMKAYSEIPTGVFGLMMMKGLQSRYNSGERTPDLYESMMDVQ